VHWVLERLLAWFVPPHFASPANTPCLQGLQNVIYLFALGDIEFEIVFYVLHKIE
jgi:hypothetical protein